MTAKILNQFDVLAADFYHRDTTQVAQELIGKWLFSRCGGRLTGGIIVETEAYLPKGDSACHAARGQTRKNRSMFGSPGWAYVYPIHAKYCFNVVTESVGTPAAVLIRAIEPRLGVAVMRERRQSDNLKLLVSGPARLCQALKIDRQLDGWDLTIGKRLWVAQNPEDEILFPIAATARIGVTSAHELPLRFVHVDSPWLSRRIKT